MTLQLGQNRAKKDARPVKLYPSIDKPEIRAFIESKARNSRMTATNYRESIYRFDSFLRETYPNELDAELKRRTKSLSFNRLDIHLSDYPKLTHLPNRRALQYPRNSTLVLAYDPILQGLTGFIQVEVESANDMLKSGAINSVSIEYLSLGEINGRGIVGRGLALVTSDTKAADKKAGIYRA